MKTSTTIGLALLVAATACGVKVNGKTLGTGGGGTSVAANPDSGGARPKHNRASGASARYAPAPSQCYAATSYDDQPPYLETPVDPWIAVDGERPRAFEGNFESPRPDADCSALHDHCVRECRWFVVEAKVDATLGREPHSPRLVYYKGEENHDWANPVMYRTVPATKRNLKPGSLVAVVEYPRRTAMGDDSGPWLMGRLDKIDYKAGKLFLKGKSQPYWLSAARVAVLAYRRGGAIELLDGRTRDELAVRADELFLPQEDTASTSEPWSQVGGDGQPLAADDDRALETSRADCSSKRDHCLREWTWFVDVTTHVEVGRFTGGKLVDWGATPFSSFSVAYRTAPATRDTLRPGMRVIARLRELPASEYDAHTQPWRFVVVKAVRPDGTFTIAGESETPAIEQARIPVLFWAPGDKAEKL